MKVVDCAQGTAEWKQARCGRITASRIADVMAKIKSGEAAGRRNYRAELVVERLTKLPVEDGYVSREMQYGIDNEIFARTAYELQTGNTVTAVGFVEHPRLTFSGASPDGLIDGGCIEIKVPNTATHIAYILASKAPAEYEYQMLWEMACTDRPFCDFVSFDSRMPAHLRLFIVRFERDDKRIAEIEKEVVRFDGEVDDVIARLTPDPEPELETKLKASLANLGITESDCEAVK